MNSLKYSHSEETLTWGNERYKAVSGPHGKGRLPTGNYDILTRNVVTGAGLSHSFRDQNGIAWFIPIGPLFGTTRDGLGIHPDGGVPGTLGCIGLTGADATKFWSRWNNIVLGARPQRLVVE